MTDLHTKARDEAGRLRAAGDDGAADLVDALLVERDRLREAVEGLLRCPAISDGDLGSDVWGCAESLGAEIEARAALTPHGAVTPETKGET